MGFHGLREDFEKLQPLLEKADVYIPEKNGWDERFLENYNRVAQGETPLINPTLWDRAEPQPLRWIHGTKKHVAIVDVPKDHPALEKLYQGFDEIHSAYITALKGDFDRAITEVREGVALETAGNIEREEHIIEEIRKLIPLLPERFPDLKGKKDIKVLMSIGATHTPLAHELKNEPISDTRVHMKRSDKVTHYSHLEELTRRQHWGKEISDELCAKVMIEDLIKWTADLEAITKYTNEENVLLRQMISRLSLDEIREIFEPLEDEITFSNRKVRELLWEHGVKIEDGLDQDIYTT